MFFFFSMIDGLGCYEIRLFTVASFFLADGKNQRPPIPADSSRSIRNGNKEGEAHGLLAGSKFLRIPEAAHLRGSLRRRIGSRGRTIGRHRRKSKDGPARV